MDSIWRENKWKHRPKELYPDVSCKDAPVPAALPVPKCDCGMPAEVTQSMHPDTAARAHYMCRDYREEERCYFFQWIDGPEMVDTRILHFKRWGTTKPYERFKRWVPPPPNPPPMSAEEKEEAIARRRANPPLCKCGVPAVIESTPFTPTFKCRNRNKNGYPLCDFSEYDFGTKSYWPDPVEKKEKKKVTRCPDTMCHCGVKANHGLVPSELGVGYYCGHMVGDALATRKCDYEFYFDKEVECQIVKRRRFGKSPEVLNSYVRNRKEEQQKLARSMGVWPRVGVDPKEPTLFELWKKSRNRRADNVDGGGSVRRTVAETMKALVSNLPNVPEKDGGDPKEPRRHASNWFDGEGSDSAAKKVQDETMKALVANLPNVPEKDGADPKEPTRHASNGLMVTTMIGVKISCLMMTMLISISRCTYLNLCYGFSSAISMDRVVDFVPIVFLWTLSWTLFVWYLYGPCCHMTLIFVLSIVGYISR